MPSKAAHASLEEAADVRLGLWDGVNSNHRPTDYEFAPERRSHLRQWLKALVRPFTRLLSVRMGWCLFLCVLRHFCGMQGKLGDVLPSEC
jgi:hypothetical protein